MDHDFSKTPFATFSWTPSDAWEYSKLACDASFASIPLFLPSAICFSRSTSCACASMILMSVLTVSLLRSVEGACKKFSLMYVNMPAAAWNEWYAALMPVSSERFWFAAWHEWTAEMLNIIDAFSNASEYCDVCLCVNASFLVPKSAMSTSDTPYAARPPAHLPRKTRMTPPTM